ncbi:MAG: MFS transporter [Caldiserica bacterium]|nr:MFS transporter [Caldisericota bacterium]
MYHKFRLYGFLKNLRFFDPFIILFFREMGLSFFEIGALFSIRELATNFLEIPTGVVADAFGRRKAMLASFTSYILSFLIFYAAPGFWTYALAMVLFAFGETFRSGTHKAMILEYLRIKGIERLKVHYYGHTRAGSQLGSALAALIAAGLVFYSGSYRIVFLASVVPYVLGLFLFLTYPKELDGEVVRVTGAWRRKLAERLTLTGRDFLSMLRDPHTLKGLLHSAAFDGVFKATKDYLQPILKSQALALPVLLSLSPDKRTALLVGILYFFLHLGTSFASQNAGRVEAGLRSLPLAVNVTYLSGMALLLLAGAGEWLRIYGLAIAAFVGLYLLQNVRRPMMVGYLSDVIPQRVMASGLSVESQLKTLVLAMLAPAVGRLADALGVGPALMLVAGGALSLSPFLRVAASHGAPAPAKGAPR